MQINLKQLSAFVAVADLGSFRRAADKLNTTQPNISARIAALETTLDVRLMDRDPGSVTLTPRGRVLLAKAREVLAAMDGFLLASGDARLFEGTLRLGVTEMIVHSWLGDYLARLKSRFPRIDVDLSVDLSKNLSEALFSREIDLALQNGPFHRSISGMVPLGQFPMIWVASEDLPIAQGALSLHDLTTHAILTHARGTLPFDQIEAHLKSAGASARMVPSTNMAAGLAMTHQKLGVACVPEIMVRDQVAEGQLVRLDYAWRPDDLVFAARYEAEIAPHHVVEAARLAGEVAAATNDKNS